MQRIGMGRYFILIYKEETLTCGCRDGLSDRQLGEEMCMQVEMLRSQQFMRNLMWKLEESDEARRE